MKITSLFLLVLINSCSQQSISTNDIYIVPLRLQVDVQTKANEPPPPPQIQTYYLPSAFIVDSTGQIYFYQQQQYGWFCGTDFNWNTPPQFINLKPKDIVQVPVNSITEFIKLNILFLDSSNRRVAIASLKDTIESAGLSKIFAEFNNSSNKIKWHFRKATQEENIVLRFKKLNWKYYPDEINWDSTKIWFPLKVDSSNEFTPPK